MQHTTITSQLMTIYLYHKIITFGSLIDEKRPYWATPPSSRDVRYPRLPFHQEIPKKVRKIHKPKATTTTAMIIFPFQLGLESCGGLSEKQEKYGKVVEKHCTRYSAAELPVHLNLSEIF